MTAIQEQTTEHATQAGQATAEHYEELGCVLYCDPDLYTDDDCSYLATEEEREAFREDPSEELNSMALELKYEGSWSIGETPRPSRIILLNGWGGPAVRTIVDLDNKKAWVEVQDWYTPWVKVSDLSSDVCAMLLEQYDPSQY